MLDKKTAEHIQKIDTQKVEEPGAVEPEKPRYDFDYSQIYCGADYEVCYGIKVHQPSVEEWITFNDEKYWTMVFYLCANPTSMLLPLWEMGIDWTEIDDFDLFCLLAPSLDYETTRLVFPDLDWSKFRPVDLGSKKILVNLDNPKIILEKDDYMRMAEYLRTMFNYHPKTEKYKNKTTRDLLIWEAQDNRRVAKLKRDKGESKENGEVLTAMLSFTLNHPGFKYKKEELSHITVYQYLDAIKRLQNTETTLAFLYGIYSGMIDTSKMSKAELQKQLDLTRVL